MVLPMRATMVLVPTLLLLLLLLLLLPCCHDRAFQRLRRDGSRAACWHRLPSFAIVHLARRSHLSCCQQTSIRSARCGNPFIYSAAEAHNSTPAHHMQALRASTALRRVPGTGAPLRAAASPQRPFFALTSRRSAMSAVPSDAKVLGSGLTGAGVILMLRLRCAQAASWSTAIHAAMPQHRLGQAHSCPARHCIRMSQRAPRMHMLIPPVSRYVQVLPMPHTPLHAVPLDHTACRCSTCHPCHAACPYHTSYCMHRQSHVRHAVFAMLLPMRR